MVNIFGDRGVSSDDQHQPGPSGPRGMKGDPGRSGIYDMCRWMPDLTLEQFQKNKTCCFLLTDPRKDLIKTAAGTYVTWISQSVGKKNAVAIHPSKKVLCASKTHNALAFDKSLYVVDDVALSLSHLCLHMCNILGIGLTRSGNHIQL